MLLFFFFPTFFGGFTAAKSQWWRGCGSQYTFRVPLSKPRPVCGHTSDPPLSFWPCSRPLQFQKRPCVGTIPLSALRLGPRKNLFAACPSSQHISSVGGVPPLFLSLPHQSGGPRTQSKALSGRFARALNRVVSDQKAQLHCRPRARPFLSLGLSLSICRRRL